MTMSNSDYTAAERQARARAKDREAGVARVTLRVPADRLDDIKRIAQDMMDSAA
jgi:hypothetical protein